MTPGEIARDIHKRYSHLGGISWNDIKDVVQRECEHVKICGSLEEMTDNLMVMCQYCQKHLFVVPFKDFQEKVWPFNADRKKAMEIALKRHEGRKK